MIDTLEHVWLRDFSVRGSQTAGDLIAVAGKNKRKDWYIRIARWMLVVAAVTGVLWLSTLCPVPSSSP